MMADHATIRPDDYLLPWHATGRLSPDETCRIDRELAHDPTLAQVYARICQERAGYVAMANGDGKPSPRALQALFAAIDLDIAAREKTS